MSGELVTVERLKRARFDLAMHLNMGSHGHVMAYRCVEFPRLTVERLSKRGGKVEQTIAVDGVEVPDLAAAARALNAPPAEPVQPSGQLELGL